MIIGSGVLDERPSSSYSRDPFCFATAWTWPRSSGRSSSRYGPKRIEHAEPAVGTAPSGRREASTQSRQGRPSLVRSQHVLGSPRRGSGPGYASGRSGDIGQWKGASPPVGLSSWVCACLMGQVSPKYRRRPLLQVVRNSHSHRPVHAVVDQRCLINPTNFAAFIAPGRLPGGSDSG